MFGVHMRTPFCTREQHAFAPECKILVLNEVLHYSVKFKEWKMTDDFAEQAQKAITADDVAALAGVSRWTVNRAFRRDASISKKSLEKVLEAAERLGYVPDLSAASLKSGQSNLVALIMDDFANPHKLLMLERLTRVLRRNGWDTLLVNMLDEEDAPSALLNASQRRVDAAVLIGVDFNDQVLDTARGARRIRKLVIFARKSEHRNTISICCDDLEAMATMADYVIGKGYKKPLFVAGPQARSARLLRKESFCNKWLEACGETPPSISIPVYDPLSSCAHVAELLKSLPDGALPDILICENDALAMGAIDAIRYRFGLRVPEDIAVVGFDDVPEAASPNYQLTTYRQPISAMAEGLVEILKDEQKLTRYDNFKGHIVIRGSA
jgi:DNA-binding LacI/PurR family transcriptional regulator